MDEFDRIVREYRFEQRAQRIAIIILVLFIPLAAYAVAIAAGLVPPTPWSPMGVAAR